MAVNTGQFVFFTQDSSVLESNVYGVGANGGSCLTIQIIPQDSSVTTMTDNIKVLGSTDMQSDKFDILNAINLKNFKTTNTLNTPDTYMVICSGVNYIKLVRDVANTSVKVFAVSVD